jgi:hypothetical protein
MDVESVDPALRAANLALVGHSQRETNRFASIELRFVDHKSGRWEAAAFVSVATMAILVVIGIWCL